MRTGIRLCKWGRKAILPKAGKNILPSLSLPDNYTIFLATKIKLTTSCAAFCIDIYMRKVIFVQRITNPYICHTSLTQSSWKIEEEMTRYLEYNTRSIMCSYRDL